MLIAIGGSAFALTKEQTGFTKVSEKAAKIEDEEKEKKDPVRIISKGEDVFFARGIGPKSKSISGGREICCDPGPPSPVSSS